jgi:HSP20 family protein
MSLMRWQPLKDLTSLRQQFNHLFDTLSHAEPGLDLLPSWGETAWVPAIELQETATDLILKAELPGMAADDLDVQVSERRVTIAGEHREEKRTEERGYFQSELNYGRFQRLIPLPIAVQPDQVKAEFQNGILRLTLPKVPAQQRHTVKVDLSMNEKAREAMARQRQHEEHLEETMRARAIEEPTEEGQGNGIQSEARTAMAAQRQSEEHLQETMLSRASEPMVS